MAVQECERDLTNCRFPPPIFRRNSSGGAGVWSAERGGGGARQMANSSVSCVGGCEARGRVDGYRFNRAERERPRVVGRLETAAGILFLLVERELRLPTKKCHRDWERRDARMGSSSQGQVILAGEGKCGCHGKKR